MTPEFAGVEGDACISFKACGTGPNSPCCPSAYRTAFNPDTSKSHCPANFFCDYDEKKGLFPGSKLLGMPTGLCLRNAADCGKVGKPCCVNNGGSRTALKCEPEPGPGKKGYCAAKDGSTEGVKDKNMICQLCPASGSTNSACKQESG
ncbi:hypothetical protein OEZ86_007776 [Tetradesmus obliquus]|nr:hypothetical protein OEZ86_007776 [Tetradesmus obliquus]